VPISFRILLFGANSELIQTLGKSGMSPVSMAARKLEVCAGYRPLLIGTLAVIWMLSTIDTARAVGPGPVPTPRPAPSDCPRLIYWKELHQQGKLFKYDFAPQCARDGSDGPYAGRPHLEKVIHLDGTACQIQQDASVTFQDFTGYISASWSSPTGAANELRLWPYSDGTVVSTAAIKASNSSVYAVYARNGTYQNNDCQPQSAWKSLCWEGRGTEDPCTYTVPYSITRPNSPPPSVAPYIAEVLAEVKGQAGTINSLPNPKGLVNLPTCFWLDNIGVPAEQNYALVLAGPPDASGRQIFYMYLIRLFFAGIDWNFDDPLGNAETAPHPACGQHPQLTAHTYQTISEKRGNADGTYHVTAKEMYQLTIDMYWADSYTRHHEPVDPGVQLPITISTDPAYHQFIGQVEGIPVG
jgi:hypothetical protein